MISRWMTRKSCPEAPYRRKQDPDDPQRDRLYRMERNWCGWGIYSHVEQDDLQRVADYVCRQYRVKRAVVQVVNEGKKLEGDYGEGLIRLNADMDGDNLVTLVHELAHHVVDSRYPGLPHHGAAFVNTYGELLDKLNLLPRACFDRLCEIYYVSAGDDED